MPLRLSQLNKNCSAKSLCFVLQFSFLKKNRVFKVKNSKFVDFSHFCDTMLRAMRNKWRNFYGWHEK